LQTLWGPVLGAVLLTVLPEALRFTNEYRLILYGLIIVVVVLRRPEGLLTRVPTGRGISLFGHVLVPARTVAETTASPRSRLLPLSLRRGLDDVLLGAAETRTSLSFMAHPGEGRTTTTQAPNESRE
jgi:hypothetical protein